jgi:hypothetical protein
VWSGSDGLSTLMISGWVAMCIVSSNVRRCILRWSPEAGYRCDADPVDMFLL